MKIHALVMTALALGASAVQAQALPVAGGVTAVKLTAFPTLDSLGVAVAPLGTASVSPGSDLLPIAYFPVTGGTFNTATFAGGIAHEGSGLSLTRGGTTIELENFFIDTASLQLLGDVTIGGGTPIDDFVLFDVSVTSPTNPFFPLTLEVSPAAGGALESFLGLNAAGLELGLANTLPITTAVPEPSTYAMLLAGLGVIGWVARRRANG